MNYVELHLHDHYSTLDGVGSPAEYFARAKELGMTHLAQTNHGTLSGWREWQQEAQKAGITPILGVEAYISETDRFDRRSVKKRDDNTQAYNHIGLLALNENGMKNLNLMNAEAWKGGFYSKPRIDIDLLEEYNEDIAVLSGCLNGLLSKSLEKDDFDGALEWAKKLKRIFSERFFIEIQGHNPPEINAGLLEIANRGKILPVVTSDCHHVRKEDLWVQEAVLILSTKPDKGDYDFSKSQKMDYLERFNYLYPERKMTFEKFNLHLNSAVEHKEALAKQGIGTDPITNTMEVAKMVGSYPMYQGLDLLPKPKTKDPAALLRKKVFEGLKARGLEKDPVYIERAEHELEIINGKNFSSYFLIVADAVAWARSQRIRVGPGRGSAAGSLVCYSLKITDVDPIEHGLLFFRFIDPDRDDYPDADIDFQDSRRQEVKDYVTRKFGHVASIATFGYFSGNGTIKDAARVFCIPVAEVNKALKNINSFEEYQSTQDPKCLAFKEKYPEVEELTIRLRGHIRSIGMHAGGLVISKEPLENYVPLQTASHDGSAERVPVVANDMKQVADIGLIKMDFLGLKALSVLEDTIQLIKDRHSPDFEIENVPLDDKRVYDMLSEGYTKGVFQCETGPYTKLLISMGGVKDFSELAASNALVRPGSANASFGEAFIKGKNGEGYEYIHACTKDFTSETYGQIIYQEQQMQLCTELAGMSMKDANKVRKAIGKKIAEDLAVWKDVFIDGATKKIGAKKAEALWHDLEAAADYSFNKSHAVAYSLVSYWTAWLKVNYPIEFMTCTLKNEGDKDSRLDYLIETKRLGIRIKLPNINYSDVDFSIQSDNKGDFIRMGLSTIKFVSKRGAMALIGYRPFRSYAELAVAVDNKGNGLSTKVLDALNKVGAATFADNPKRGNERDNFFEYLSIPAFDITTLPPKVMARFRSLDSYTDDEAFIVSGLVRNVKTGPTWALVDIIDETGSAGIFTDPNTPIEKGEQYVIMVANNRIARYASLADLGDGKDEGFLKFLEADKINVPEGKYKVVTFRTRITKTQKKMADVVLVDAEKNLYPVLVFPREYHACFVRMRPGAVVNVELSETKDGALAVKSIK